MSAPCEAKPSKARRVRRRAIEARPTLCRNERQRLYKEAEE